MIIGSAAVAIFSVSTLILLGKNEGSNTVKNTATTKSPITAQNANTTTNNNNIKPTTTTVDPKNNSTVIHQPVVNNNPATNHNLPISTNPTENKTTTNTDGNKVGPETKTDPVTNSTQHTGTTVTPVNPDDNNVISPNHETSVVINLAKIAKIEFTTSGSSTYAPLTVYFVNKGKAVTEEWSFGDGSFPRFEKNPVYLFEYPGEYTIILTATNEAGRVEKDSIKIKIKSNAFFIPNTFTPNGDGQNDSYKIIKNDNYPYEMTNLEIVIYDRMNGKMAAFNSVDYGWDGRSIKDGRMCPQGTYMVLIKYTSSEDGKSHEERGYLFLKD